MIRLPLALGGLSWLASLLLPAQTPLPDPTALDLRQTPAGLELESAAFAANQVLTLSWSSDLQDWSTLARVHGELAPYPVRPPWQTGFFALETRPARGDDDYTNQLWLDRSQFLSELGPGLPKQAKWSLALGDPAQRIYFQDTRAYPFHYPFIVRRIPGYGSMSLAQFEQWALTLQNQRLLVGGVLVAPNPSLREAAIEFVGQEAFPPAQVVQWFDQVRSRLAFSRSNEHDWRLFYFPTYEQRASALAHAAYFASQGIIVDSLKRWISSSTCYAHGWALGKVVFVPGDEIDAAYGDGRLTGADILLTDAVPAEVPPVAGIVTLHPATPNSHVAILARSLRLPMAYITGEALVDAWTRLAENQREILLVVSSADDADPACDVKFTDITARLTEAQRRAILDLKKPPTPDIKPKRPAGTLALSVEDLTPEDIDRVGGKAANFGFLRRALPQESPWPALALTFDLWDGFLAQPFSAPGAEGATLAEAIDARLQGITYPPDLGILRPALLTIREWIEKKARFSAAQQEAILQALQPFDAHKKIRFRSSTNVEDSAAFSGAGLYASYSGCLADDIDHDEDGPGGCGDDEERGVFRALRKVYASFYQENAYLERLRHGILENDVGMAVLVHHSFPDSLEEGNSVATVELSPREDGTWDRTTTLVSQPGSESVTNPSGRGEPEIVLITGPEEAVLQQRATLLPEGTIYHWPADYHQLDTLLWNVAQAYVDHFTTRQKYVLDYEIKQVKGQGFIVKQVRPIPQLPVVPPPQLEF